ncbi:hypothetical protein F5148DRAFT_742387 [Russula earlei]|uniref:Uncharacterized protein n=1 Tax=Russula earlei TaxID=71964 RepID=A0ACC0UCX8_9AGAM|nr:hypothetical protein F5148DRAFT_742387 [Russula earlei]
MGRFRLHGSLLSIQTVMLLQRAYLHKTTFLRWLDLWRHQALPFFPLGPEAYPYFHRHKSPRLPLSAFITQLHSFPRTRSSREPLALHSHHLAPTCQPTQLPTPPAPSPTSARSWRDKAKAKLEKSSQQSTQEGSGRRRSNSWTVVSSVFRRRSGRQSGPAPLTTSDGPAQLTASNWRDLAQWAYRSIDNTWGESFVPEVDTSLPIEREASSSTYDQTLPPLPPHLSHLSAPSAPLVRVNSSTSALNPFLVHRSVGLPLLSWDLRTAARAILFPASGPGASAVPMAASDYSQPATWPPTGALRIGAIGGHAGWRWPVDVRNPAGVRCGDLFRALIANLHEFVLPYELADMSPENVALIIAACTARVAAGFPHGWTSVPSSSSSFAPDGIRRVDCLLGYTLFHGLGPGPGTGEWTMFVGAP